MRKLSKILVLVLALAMMFTLASMFTASAASQPEYLYLTPSANWKQSNARFAAYFFGNGETWVSMTDSNGDGVYEVKVPTSKVYPNVIFCRMNPSASANNWNNKWNQTADLVIPTSGANHYTIKEGTWDKGGGTWSTYGSTCAHTNLGPAATCTTAQECKDCGDPVVSALGHTYNSAHLCTRCNGQATFTVAGSGAHLGTEWDTGNVANDMTFADGVYTKVYTNVAAGSYLLKVARDHDWGTAYPGSDKAYTVATAGSTVTVTLKGTTVTITVEAPHTHSFSDATCTEPSKCECGETEGEALGHDFVEGVCSRCEEKDPNYVPPHVHSFVDGKCECGEYDPSITRVATLEELLAALAADNDNVIIIITQIVVPEGETVVMDLNGKTVNSVFNGNSTTNHIYALSNKGTLTINDTVGGGSLNSRGVYNYGTLTLNGGKIACIDGNGGYAMNNETGSTFVMNGGEIAATYEDDYQSSSGGYDATPLDVPAGCVATLNGGKITNVCDFTFAIASAGTLNIPATSTLEVVGTHGAIAISGGVTTIDAGKFSIPSDEYSRTDNVIYVYGGSIVINGGEFIGDYDTASGGSCVCDTVGTATINGGSFVGSSGGDVWGTTGTTIKGGTFEDLRETSHIAPGFELDENGTVVSKHFVAQVGDVKYETLAEALENGSEIVLLDNVNLDAPIVVTGTLVLDLNGFTLSYESDVMGEAMITNKGNLTINDSVGTGVINYNYVGANDASYGKGNYTISNAGTLTVNGGKITIANLRSHAKYPIDNNSTTGDAILVINGGHLYNYNTSAIRMFCNSTTNKNSVTINGGVVEGYCAVWVQNPGSATVNGDLTITGGEIRTTAAAWVNGTANLNEVSSALYFTIAANGGAWSEASFVSITGGTFNENVYLADSAPANISVGEGATFNGYVELPHTHSWSDATCTEPSKCSCGETQGEALGHTWADATCEAAKTCSVCGATDGEALGHTYENCVCTGCQAVLPTLGATDSFDFTTADGLNAALASGKLGYTGTFRNNGDSHQFAADSSIQFVVPANTTVTLTGHSTGYGVFTVYVNGVKHDMAGALVFTVTEESNVVIVPDETATYSKAYLKGIALAEYVDRTITSDTTITFGSEGNYKDSLVDFSGIQIGDNGGNNSQVKNGSFDLLLKAGSKVVIHGYPGYTSYKLNDGEEITSEYYTYLALVDMVLTVTPVSGNNYFYSIEVTLHTGLTLVEAKSATCTEAGYAEHYACECHGALTDKAEVEALGHTPGAEANCTTAQTCTVCGAELVAKLGHIDADLDINCDREGCTSKVAPPADSVLSNFTANQLGSLLSTSNQYYVVGTIVDVLDQKNGVFLVDDGTGEKFYFRLPKNADGVAHSSWEIKLTLGDKVQVYGKINKYSTTTAPNGQYWPAMQSPVVTLLEQHAHVPNGAIVCTKDTLCACGTLVAPAVGHIDADTNGICDNCPWDMNLVEVNIAIGTDSKYNGVRVDDEAGKALSWTWSAGGFDAIISKGTSTVTLYTTAKDYMQLKKQNLLTIVNTEDVTVKYITISVTNATYLTHLKTALTNSGYEYTADETNFTATIQLNSAEDFVLENKASSTIYVNGVSIVYAKKGAHVHEFTGTVTTPATCLEAGVKTFTCTCGVGTYTEAIEALGHDFVEGVCSRCNYEDPNYVPPCAHKDAGLDAKCDVCGEYFLPTSPFKLEMYQATKKETYYFTGTMSGYYFATSTDITKAVDLYAEEVEGGYNVYFMSGSTKNYLYIELSGTHINAKFGSTKAVWYVDAKYGSLTTEVNGTKYFLGTYSTYVTFGGTAYSRLNDSTADVSQYVGRAVSLENHECTNTTATVTAPTCTAQGYTTYKCADCGLSTKGNYVDALGHTPGAEANCTTAQTCTVCNAVLAEALGHTPGAEATCTTAQTCTVCNEVLVDALGHEYETVVTDPTCVASGYTTYTCACGDTYVGDVVEATGHTAGAEATCTTPQVCTVCNGVIAEALGHKHEAVVTAPTCTEAGYTTYTCVCGDTYTADETEALGHTYTDGKCACGAEDPDYTPEQPSVEEPVEELNFFEKILAWFKELIQKFIALFKKD